MATVDRYKSSLSLGNLENISSYTLMQYLSLPALQDFLSLPKTKKISFQEILFKMLSLILVFFYLLACSIFGVQAMPMEAHYLRRHGYLHSRFQVPSLRLPRWPRTNEAVQSANSWSNSRLEEGSTYANGYTTGKRFLEDDTGLYTLYDEISNPF